MKDWARLTIRAVGVLHLLYGAIGCVFIIDSIARLARGNLHFGKFPYEVHLYYLLTACNALFVVTLVLAGLWLVRLVRRGVIVSNFVLLAELIYWISSTWMALALVLHGGAYAVAIGRRLGAVGGIANMGTSLQLVSGYPVIAVIALNLARRHLDRKGLWENPPLQRPAPPQ